MTRQLLREIRVLTLFAGAFSGTTACKALDDAIAIKQSEPAALIQLDGHPSGSAFTVSPVAVFYRTVATEPKTFSTAGAPSDSCSITPPSEGFFPDETNTLISAGSFVVLELSGRSDSLANPFGSPHSYALPASGATTFNPGDTVTIRVGGDPAGFPASVLAMKTVESFVVSTPSAYPPEGEDMHIKWTPPGDPRGTVFTVTIPFMTSPLPQDAKVVYCQFVDDGDAVIPIAYLAGIPNALAGKAAPVSYMRIRATLAVQPASGALLNVVSTFSPE